MKINFERHVDNAEENAAHRLRGLFDRYQVLALNFMGSAGSGKTSLLRRTLESLAPDSGTHVLVGDIQTRRDADVLAQFGFPVRPINTLGACHLEAPMIERALSGWDLRTMSSLLIENLGDLICPATWDLGEDGKVVVISVPEGDDKPLRYPSAFTRSELMIISKTDLLPYVRFDVDQCVQYALDVNPDIEVLQLSSETGEGVPEWMNWLARRQAEFTGSTSFAAADASDSLVGT